MKHEVKANSDYIELVNAVKHQKLFIIYTLSIPSSRSTLLNFVLCEAKTSEGFAFDLAVHEPLRLPNQAAWEKNSDLEYDQYKIGLRRIKKSFDKVIASSNDQAVALAIKDHSHCFCDDVNSEKIHFNEIRFCEFMHLANAGIVITIRKPAAVLNTRIRTVLNFKLTDDGGMDSEAIFTAYLAGDTQALHQHINELLKKEHSPINQERLLKELRKTSLKAISSSDWDDFRARTLNEIAETFKLEWLATKEAYETLKKHNFKFIITNTSEMIIEPENYLHKLTQKLSDVTFSDNMVNHLSVPKRFHNYAGEGFGHDRVNGIFLKNAINSTHIIKGQERQIHETDYPKELQASLEMANQIYEYLDQYAFTKIEKKV